MYAVLAISATEEEIHQRTQTQDIFPTVYAQVSFQSKIRRRGAMLFSCSDVDE